MTNLVLFSFDSHEIRVVDQDGEPWFVLRDVLDGMNSSTKLSDAVESISQGLGDGMVADLPIKDRAGRTQTTIIISEPAATYLLSRSNTLVSATESDFQFQTGSPDSPQFSVSSGVRLATTQSARPQVLSPSTRITSGVTRPRSTGGPGDSTLPAAVADAVDRRGATAPAALRDSLRGQSSSMAASNDNDVDTLAFVVGFVGVLTDMWAAGRRPIRRPA